MVREWFPRRLISSMAYNRPDWFVSALAMCWLFEATFLRVAALSCSCHGEGHIPWVGIGGIVLWILCSPFACFPLTWGDSVFGGLADITAIKSLPFSFMGTLLACWLHGREHKHRSRL